MQVLSGRFAADDDEGALLRQLVVKPVATPQFLGSKEVGQVQMLKIRNPRDRADRGVVARPPVRDDLGAVAQQNAVREPRHSQVLRGELVQYPLRAEPVEHAVPHDPDIGRELVASQIGFHADERDRLHVAERQRLQGQKQRPEIVDTTVPLGSASDERERDRVLCGGHDVAGGRDGVDRDQAAGLSRLASLNQAT